MAQDGTTARRPKWFDPHVNIGNLLTILTLIVAGTAVVIATKADVGAVARDNRRQETEIREAKTRGLDNTIKINRIEGEVTTELRQIRKAFEGVEKQFERLERKIDRIPTQP